MTLRQIIKILFGLGLLVITSCGQGQIKTPENAMAKFKEFKNKEKFVEDKNAFYPGIGNEILKPILTEKINLAADDFEEVSKKENATEQDYHNIIEKGLNRFKPIYDQIDIEDRERICLYFEELMDVVGLESSGGLLNDFVYGFDPSEK